MILTRGHHGWTGHSLQPSIPTDPDPDPGYVPPAVPTQPLAAGERWLVRVGEFPGHTDRGLIWDAEIVPSIRLFELGGNEVTITCPASDHNMRVLGDPISGYTQAGRRLYSTKQAIKRELIVGSTLTGKARWRFVIRDPWEVSGSTITIKAKGIVGGLTSDRVIGRPTRDNKLGDRIGSFESGDLTGWRVVGDDVDAGVVEGGPDGTYKAWVTGIPNQRNYIEARYRWVEPPHPWGRVRIAATAEVQLPGYGLDIEDFGLMQVVIYDVATGKEVWPAGVTDDPDAQPAVVADDMNRGAFDPNPITAIGRLPSPPFVADVWVRLYPTDETERTYFDGVQLFGRENTSTGVPRDQTSAIARLFEHFQSVTAGKSPWGVNYNLSPTGVDKIMTYWHEDGTSAQEALEQECSTSNIEIWDYPSGGRTVAAARRRGSVRHDVRIPWWEVRGVVTWTMDPGAQRTAARGTSAAGSIWGGADEGAIDTSQSGGQIIDVILSGPVGMTPEQLRAWLVTQLGSLSRRQCTTTLIVSWELGQRLQCGDTVQVSIRSAHAGHTDWMRIHAMTPSLGLFWALDVGTDVTLGGG